MRIELLDEAEQDLVDGFAFYEGKSQGLGGAQTVGEAGDGHGRSSLSDSCLTA